MLLSGGPALERVPIADAAVHLVLLALDRHVLLRLESSVLCLFVLWVDAAVSLSISYKESGDVRPVMAFGRAGPTGPCC